MEKPYAKKTPSSIDRDEKRLTTAPIRERPKYAEMYRTNNLQLPVIRGKNPGGREPIVASRDIKRSQLVKREEVVRLEHEIEQIHKRPQTSKGSRNTAKKESEYYEEGEDDLIITSMHDKLDLFKKPSKEQPKDIKEQLKDHKHP